MKVSSLNIMKKKTSTLQLGNDKTKIQFAKNLVRHLKNVGQLQGKATDEEIEAMYWKIKKETTIFPLDNEQTRYQAAVALVTHLHKVGQIKEMPSEEEMKAYWEKLKK